MRESKTCPNQGWQQMPVEELDQLLQAELEKEHPNEEVVLPILRELEEREKDHPVEKTPEVLAISDQLSKYEATSTQSKYRRGWIAGIAALAAVACIVVLALPRTVGAESFLNVLFRWTGSVFEFVDPDKSESQPKVNTEFTTDNPGLQELYDKITALGVAESVVPMWLPEGFELTELKEIPMAGGSKVFCKFENGNAAVLITYRISTDISPKVEKEDSPVAVYDYADISHFVLENDANISVTWTVDGVECLLNANIAKEDLYTVIKSIYRRSLE